MCEFSSVTKINANKLRFVAIREIQIFCNNTGSDYYALRNKCLGDLNPAEQTKRMTQSRFKFYLDFAIAAKRLNINPNN